MVNKYVGAAKFGYEKVVKPAVTAIKKTFTKKSPTITSVKPKVGSLNIRRKTQEDVIKSADKAIQKQNLTKEQGVAVKKTIAPGLKKISKTQDDIDRLEKKLSAKGKEKLKKLREKKMGGGMMGRRMGYSEGSNGKPISRSKNPGILAMSKTAKGRKVVKERFKFNPNRIVAKKGGKA
jgi:hypothetical protein